MNCARCGLPLEYEADQEGRYTMLFSVGQNGSLLCPGRFLPHIPPRGLKKIALRLASRFNDWEV